MENGLKGKGLREVIIMSTAAVAARYVHSSPDNWWTLGVCYDITGRHLV